MTSPRRTFVVLSGVALLLLLALLGLVIGHVRGLEQIITELKDANSVLERRIDMAETQLKDTQAGRADVEAALRDLQQPQPVSGPANFPISRVLAQRGDTVAALARRQSTSPEVIYALNPWLDGADALIVGQAIWIPNGDD